MRFERGLEQKKVIVKLEKSFTREPQHGSPSGIVLDADRMTEGQMLKTAQRLGFPESGFLQHSDKADARLRFFSAKQEVNACVTATLAAARIMAKLHRMRNPSKVVFETKIGVREVILRRDGLFMMKQPEVNFLDERTDREEIGKLLGIKQDQIADLPIVLASAGTPKLLIPIKTLENLLSIKPDLDQIAKYSAAIGGRGFYPFTFDTQNPGADFHARAFNPQDGIAEDPVTGVAAAALAAYIRKYGLTGKHQLLGEQGYIMNTPGEIVIEIDKSGTIYVGGYVKDFGTKEIEF